MVYKHLLILTYCFLFAGLVCSEAQTAGTSPVLIPNVFTPNGDDVNDFVDFSHLNLSESQVTIYSRWGNEVFHTTQYQRKWDGRHMNGTDCEEGVYFYIQHTKEITNKPYDLKGSVQLIR